MMIMRNTELEMGRGHLAIQIPRNKRKKSFFSVGNSDFSIAGASRTMDGKLLCQDRGLASISRRNMFLGVFDGFGSLGTDLPPALCRSLSARINPEIDYSDKQLLKALLLEASEDAKVLTARRGAILNEQGGSTASIMCINNENRFSAIGVGDSAIYHIRDGQVTRFWDHIPEYDGKTGLKTSVYLNYRNVLSRSIGPWKDDFPSRQDVDLKEGSIGQGDIIIIVSDGITKNLSFFHENGFITDIGGSIDILEMCQQGDDAGRIAGNILQESVRRIEKVPVFSHGRTIMPARDDMSVMVACF
jgi:serine/threonine protein phosphatase PrpC